MNRVVHFEIAVQDPERAIAFYKNIFGWKFEKAEVPFDYWLISTGKEADPGINGGLNRKPDAGPACTVNTIQVDSVDSTIRKIVKRGGKVIRDKSPIPGVGYLAYCEDPDGTLFGILEEDISARFY
jgi:predicted enzyme related to lactoylglutathione lyase